MQNSGQTSSCQDKLYTSELLGSIPVPWLQGESKIALSSVYLGRTVLMTPPGSQSLKKT